jgi:hypothetical protein
MTTEQLMHEIEAEIVAKRSELEGFERTLATLKENCRTRSSTLVIEPKQFIGLRIGFAARLYLLEKESASAYLDEIREALLQAGCDMGKYPKRSIKLAVVNSPKTFQWEGDEKNPLVTLRKPTRTCTTESALRSEVRNAE